MALTLMYITNDIEIALIAEKNGVERIWIDLETLGKEERQKGMNTVKSCHTVADVRRMAPLLTKSQLLVRVNPYNDESVREIDEVIIAGADLVMLPMWKTCEEVKAFISAVNGRAKTVLLLETKEAVECLESVLSVPGIDEIHIGLNDLCLSYGLTFMFELLSNGTVERLCRQISKTSIPYGFGGIACLGSGELPAERIIMEHYRLGSTRAILSRSFCNTDLVKNKQEIARIFDDNIKALRKYENDVALCSKEQFDDNKYQVAEAVRKLVQKRRSL